jgi:hypothetical protein
MIANTLRQFQDWNRKHARHKKVFLDAIDRQHILAFKKWAMEQGDGKNGRPNDWVMHVIHIRVKMVKDGDNRIEVRPKKHSVRDVALPDDLFTRLEERKNTSNSPLVFPTRTGRINLRLWDACKRIAKRAGVDASKFMPKNFRSTYATNRLRNGYTLAEVRDQLGHRDMRSVEHYADAKLRNLRLLLRTLAGNMAHEPAVPAGDAARFTESRDDAASGSTRGSGRLMNFVTHSQTPQSWEASEMSGVEKRRSDFSLPVAVGQVFT